MASTAFYIKTGDDFNLVGGGSGLGFFGAAGFGASINVGDWNESTYVTDGNGIVEGPMSHNNQYSSPTGVIVDGVGPMRLEELCNYLATLNVRFTNGTNVMVMNPKLRIYDRTNINLGASGTTTKVAEVIHISPIQEFSAGSGDSTWITPIGSSVMVDLAASPGLSGIQATANGAGSHEDTRHDWYVAISASPDSIGSKTDYGLFFQCEYL